MRKKLFLSAILMFIFYGLANGQIIEKQKTIYPTPGFYLGEKNDNYIIISVINDTCFLDGNINESSCYGCKLNSINNKLIVTDPAWTNNILYTEKSLYYANFIFKQITLNDVLVPGSDTTFFFAGLWYLTAARDSNNVARKNLLLKTAIPFFRKSISITKTETNPYINLGLAYYELNLRDSAKMYWDTGKKISPDNPRWKTYYHSLSQLYLNDGLREGENHNPKKAIVLFNKGIDADSSNAELWYNLGGAYYTIGKMKEAKKAWVATLKLDPDYIDAQRGLDAIPNSKK